MLHAQLEIWKAAVEESPRNTLAASWSPPGVNAPPANGSGSGSGSGTGATPNASGNPGTTSTGNATSCSIDYSDGRCRGGERSR